MSWLRRHKLRHYVQNSVWILPVSGMVAALLAVNVLDGVEKRIGWASNFDVDAVRTLFSMPGPC